MSSLPRLVLAVALSAAAATPALAASSHYLGPHPLAPAVGVGMCFIPGPHAHSYRPHEVDVLYVQEGRAYVFVGDPTVHEPAPAATPRHAYYGHHPVTWSKRKKQKHYCYIAGPHHHWHAPTVSARFELKGGAHWYVGEHSPRYRKRVKRRAARVRAYYGGTVVIVRPAIVVAPPVGFVGFYVAGGWHRDRVVWHGHKGKKGHHGPPGWAPAWGHRGKHGKFKVKGGHGKGGWKVKGHHGGGKMKFKARGGGGKVGWKGKGGHGGGGKVKFKAKGGGGKVKFKAKGRGGKFKGGKGHKRGKR